jgi:hypothetical protein
MFFLSHHLDNGHIYQLRHRDLLFELFLIVDHLAIKEKPDIFQDRFINNHFHYFYFDMLMMF